MKKLNKETDMKKFTVTVCRTSYGFNDIEVNAETPEQAEELALETAGDYLFSENGSEYTTAGITEKESKMTKFEIKQIVHEITIVEWTCSWLEKQKYPMKEKFPVAMTFT